MLGYHLETTPALCNWRLIIPVRNIESLHSHIDPYAHNETMHIIDSFSILALCAGQLRLAHVCIVQRRRDRMNGTGARMGIAMRSVCSRTHRNA